MASSNGKGRSVGTKQARAIKERLETFATRTLGFTWYRFAKEAGYNHSTASVWRNTGNQTLPAVPKLIELASRFRLSLDWLLLGVGSDLRDATRNRVELEEDLRTHVLATIVGPYDSDEAREVAQVEVQSGADMIAALIVAQRQRLTDHLGPKWWSNTAVIFARRLKAATSEKERARLGGSLANAVLHLQSKKGGLVFGSPVKSEPDPNAYAGQPPTSESSIKRRSKNAKA